MINNKIKEDAVSFKAIKTRSEDNRKTKLSYDEYRTTMMNSRRGKLHIPEEIIPYDKKWLFADLNPASKRDYQMELMEKGWIPVKKSMHPYFNIITEKNKNNNEDVIIRHGQILMEIDKYIWEYHEKAHYELALQGAATGGRKPNYSPANPGLFERAEGKVKEYRHERRPIRDDDF
ncbi:hypothetical protein UFOVP899_37 [uncultured Caudovirales phage]|jgi:hypothetical protein|uniref:Uncharacterized protein n=3 Tax=uncultured Caudovirales phage TaxID=2100421 RepID=A0A6J5PIP5_9CAUD|nr:hypothetical protein UFOVP899_37 [uncultured Caudovirales phage]CAB4176508.1 hypothetical protein UFOVP987_36 [uncultured Caudovirales phage]CAB4197670.1 hypothetical protein UFOVP1310_14 [uncultured Caudovirales phage]CAB4210931.1 hypothetical protein UFOVP1424_58 [uncultured Caudovirales phage]CAB5227603.1 hypothetical protein UFOVP1521_58 [uncultured Caudovirales phage]